MVINQHLSVNAASFEMLVHLASIYYYTLWLLPSVPVHWFHSLIITEWGSARPLVEIQKKINGFFMA